MKELLRSTVVRIVALALVIIFAVVFVSLRLKNNDLRAQADSLRAEIDAANGRISELQADLDRPFDDEYVAEIAHEKLGLRYPQEIVFYNGEGK